MKSVSARLILLFTRNAKLIFCTSLSLAILWCAVATVFPTFTHAQTAPTAGWVLDPEVTLVGKAAERGRQLLWWTIRNPGIYSAPVLAEYWSITRNIVYVMILFVVVMFGFSFILLRRRASMATVTPILLKIAFVLLFATFSYILILALIQFSEITMRFFIEQVGGRDLFNVIFSGAGNGIKDPFESNYKSFIGYREISNANQEMVQTSLFLIRFTTFTYYVLAIMLLLRTIILWFLMVLSPFLVVLLPFVFIRNTGLIWIGVFFQWLFYGPLVAIFLGAITKIWVKGIPFPFDFSRTGKPAGQVYNTSINILYGGPAQQLGPANSANYVDTFAEYVIALIMLWAAIILPWLLLRIFRDYCCIAIAAGNATLNAIYDRLRQYPAAPPPPGPSTTPAGQAVDLPFRQAMDLPKQSVAPARVEMIKEIEKSQTKEIVKELNLSVSSLSDVSRIETNSYMQSQLKQQLNNLATPASIASSNERERFSILRQELQARANTGDRQAQMLLKATNDARADLKATVNVIVENRSEKNQTRERLQAREFERETSKTASSSTSTASRVSDMVQINSSISKEIAQKTGVSEETVKSVVQAATMGGTSTNSLSSISSQYKVSESAVKEIVKEASEQASIVTGVPSAGVVAQSVNMSQSQVDSVLSNMQTNTVIDQDTISQVAAKTGVSKEKVEEIYEKSQPVEPIATVMSPQIVANQTHESVQTVSSVMNAIGPVTTITNETVQEVAAKTQVSEESVRKIFEVSRSSIASIMSTSMVSEKSGVDIKTTETILSKLPVAEVVTSETLESISKETGIKKETVSEIYKSLSTGGVSATANVVADKLKVSEATVGQVAVLLPKQQLLETKDLEKIATDTKTSKDAVEKVYKSTQMSIADVMPSVIPEISKRMNLDAVKVTKVVSAMPAWGTVSYKTLMAISRSADLPVEKVKEIGKLVTSSMTAKPQQSIEEISKITGESEMIVKAVLAALPIVGYPSPSRMADAAKKSGVSEARVKAIVTAAHTTPKTNTGLASTISLEDYEEVKRMWLNHYRSSPVPVTETIKTREQWLDAEAIKLKSVSDLLASADPKLKEKGLEKVSEILPFLLLGGFSDVEILTYMKAKEEAVKAIIEEEKIVTKTTKETEKRVADENESTMVDVKESTTHQEAATQTLQDTFDTGDDATPEPAVSTSQASGNWVGQITNLSTNDISNQLKVTISNLKDLVSLETEADRRAETLKTLSTIASPFKADDGTKRSDFGLIRRELESRAAKGDKASQRILTASNNPPEEITPAVSYVLTSNRKEGQIDEKSVMSPDDYEAVKAMWKKFYKESPVPTDPPFADRKAWLTNEKDHLDEVTLMLSSTDVKKKQEGLEKISETVPFILLGGFSDLELSVYFKARVQALKEVIEEIGNDGGAKKDQSSLVDAEVTKKPEEKPKATSLDKDLGASS